VTNFANDGKLSKKSALAVDDGVAKNLTVDRLLFADRSSEKNDAL